MATKQELIEEAEEFAKELGVSIKTDGLNHSELTRLVSELESKFDAKLSGSAPEHVPPAPPKDDPKPPADKVVNGKLDDSLGGRPIPKELPPSPFAYSIAAGKAVQCRSGMLREGDEVRVGSFSENADEDRETLTLLIRKGVVLDNRK